MNHSFASKATFMSASRSLRQNEVPLRQAPDSSLNGRKKVVAKTGPVSLTFCQIVALMLPHRSVVAGRLVCWLVADGQHLLQVVVQFSREAFSFARGPVQTLLRKPR